MSKKQILCIEDNPTNMLLVARVVGAEAHHLIKADDGETAIALLNEGPVPDLILLDVNLPGMSGLDIARGIRAGTIGDGSEAYLNVPIIALTANVLEGDREKCLEAGCNDYMPKPLNIRTLRELMREILV